MAEPYRANEFVVEIGAVESPTVNRVTGLSLGETGTIEVVEPGTNVVRKVSSGQVRFQPLTIERYVDGSPDDQLFREFFEQVFQRGGGGTGSTRRRDGAVVKKHFGQEVFRVAFFEAWVKSVSFSDMAADSGDLLSQTVVLEHNGLQWVPTT
jgi:phage tail-like protein